ncbi:MAG: metal ABC transporter permease, partial [Planctomycetia bacterium]
MTLPPAAAGGDPLAMHAWALATAAVTAAACSLVGTLLVVRRMSLLGDAIAHAVLPGIVIAVLAGGRPGGPLVFAAAVAAALVTVWLTQALKSGAGLAEDAGAGLVFTTMFALGVALVSAAGRGAHIDAACILGGDLTFVPFDTVTVAGCELPRAFLTGGLVLVLLAAAAWATWKLQVFTAFDAAAARAVGLPVAAVTAGLLAATAVATVASFQAVGAILVVALLVVPAATAELLTTRLHRVAVVAVVLG